MVYRKLTAMVQHSSSLFHAENLHSNKQMSEYTLLSLSPLLCSINSINALKVFTLNK